jgi:hypothetical protein
VVAQAQEASTAVAVALVAYLITHHKALQVDRTQSQLALVELVKQAAEHLVIQERQQHLPA